MVSMNLQVTDALLREHQCCESVDKVSDPDTKEFKRRARLHQTLWRQSKGLPIGTNPMDPARSTNPKPLGSRLDLAFSRQSMANFMGPAIEQSVRDRVNHPQQYQTLNEDRLYCDLLSSMPMCFNLFGWFFHDMPAATQAVKTWWPNTPGKVCAVQFEWSPGRSDPQYLGNRSAFDVAFVLELEDGARGVIGIETKYHEDCKPEAVPTVNKLQRYRDVTNNSNAFKPNALKAIEGTDLQQIWLDHLLALSMLQHPTGNWKWSKFVLVHPQRNPSYERACARYQSLLSNSSTFEVRTIESMLAAGALPAPAVSAFRERYLW